MKKIKINDLLQFIKNNLLPIATLGVFILIIVVLLIPKLSQIFSDIEAITQNNQIIKEKNSELLALSSLKDSYPQIAANLNLINTIAPSGVTQVLSFRDKITELAETNSLTVTAQSFSENEIINTQSQIYKDSSGNVLMIQSIPSLFSIEGKYDSIISFIKGLDSIGDFVVIKQMDFIVKDRLNPLATPKTEIRFDKFLFNSTNTELLRGSYLQIPSTLRPSEEFLDYINTRYKDLL